MKFFKIEIDISYYFLHKNKPSLVTCSSLKEKELEKAEDFDHFYENSGLEDSSDMEFNWVVNFNKLIFTDNPLSSQR